MTPHFKLLDISLPESKQYRTIITMGIVNDKIKLFHSLASHHNTVFTVVQYSTEFQVIHVTQVLLIVLSSTLIRHSTGRLEIVAVVLRDSNR